MGRGAGRVEGSLRSAQLEAMSTARGAEKTGGPALAHFFSLWAPAGAPPKKTHSTSDFLEGRKEGGREGRKQRLKEEMKQGFPTPLRVKATWCSGPPPTSARTLDKLPTGLRRRSFVDKHRLIMRSRSQTCKNVYAMRTCSD